MSFNKIFLMGSIKNKQPVQSKEGNLILKFTIKTWDKEGKEFIDCVGYGKIAEIIQSDFLEGDTIFIEGKAHTWLDGGMKKTTVICERFRSYSLKNVEF
jgi:single-stranded DNA-binding protein